MISHYYKCIFIHIPKTGGASIEKIIWPSERTEADLWMGFIDNYHNRYQTGGLQHLLSRQIRVEVGDDIFTNYYKFSFVRNPWDKAVSQYCYMSKRQDLRDFIGMKSNDSFKKYLDLIKLKKHVQWEPQTSFLKDHNGELLVDYIGRFETLHNDTALIFSHLGIKNNELPHIGKSVRRHYSEYYDNESVEMIEEMYSEDIYEYRYSYL